MGNETSKANKRRIGTYIFNKVFSGKGIDIGCGRDCLKASDFPNIVSVEGFDKNQGDIQYIGKYKESESFDFVYSSHALEHLESPGAALLGWWNLVKYGGYIVFVVPDEDLYEMRRFNVRSHYSREHKHSFTINKKYSWCKHSINILDIISILPNCSVIKVELIDTNYDYSLQLTKQDQTMGVAETNIEVILKKEIRND